jgi:peptide/nickel transport system permease protein
MSEATMSLNETARHESLWSLTWRHFRQHRLALLSLIALLALGLMALFAGQIAPFDPNDINPRDPNVVRGYPQPPSPTHLLGTDAFNRDLFSRALYGMRWPVTRAGWRTTS